MNQRMFTNANSQTITVLGYQPESGTIKQATGSGSVGRKILPILPAKTEHRWVFFSATLQMFCEYRHDLVIKCLNYRGICVRFSY